MIRLAHARLAVLGAVVAVVAMTTAAVAHEADDTTIAVDEFGHDRNSLTGTIDEVCGPGPRRDAAAQRDGRVALIQWLDESFPEVEGFAGFSCREIHNRRTACAGRAEPATSDCWSTHAAGRAIDVMVGGAGNQDGDPVGKAVGDRIVNHLLEAVDGVPNYRARIMGIQQLLWNGTCWSTSQHADAGIVDVEQLDDDCVDDHDDHVHITLSEAGADGLTSFFTGEVADPDVLAARVVEDEVERDEHLVLYEKKTGRLLLRGLDDAGAFTDVEATGELGRGWTSLAAPDVAGNGDEEVFAYRARDGMHLLREVRGDGTLGGRVGGGKTLEAGYTLAATPDVDGDGDDELLLYRAEDGHWALHELLPGGDLGPALQADDTDLDVFFSSAGTPDLDGDGDDELVLYRRFDGHHVVMDFAVPDQDAADDAAADGHQDEAADATGDTAMFDDAVFDTDEDGEVDVDVALRHLDPLGTDEAHADDEQADADVEPPIDGEAPGVDALQVSLTAGFTAVATPDVDRDGIDEVLLYRGGDGCLAIRRVGLPAVEDLDDATESDEVATDEATAELPPCLEAPTEDAPADAGEDEPDDDEAADDLDGVDDPGARWLVESWDDVDSGWTAAITVALGPDEPTD